MTLLVLGFGVFCIGGTLFTKGGVDRSPGEEVAVPLRVHALSVSGMSLMAAGALLMVAAGL